MTDKDYKQSEDDNVEQPEETQVEQDPVLEEEHVIVDEHEDFQDDQDELIEDEPAAEKSAPSNRGSRVWMIASIVLFAALIYALIQPPFNKSSESIASVNGVSISKDAFYDMMVEAAGPSILDTMIIEEVLNQEAEQTGVKVTPEDIDSEILVYKKDYPTEEEWVAILGQIGTTEQQLREDVVMNIQIRKLLEPQTPVTDEEITLFYTENLEAMSTPDKTPTLEEKKEEIRYQLVFQKVSELAPAYIEEVRAKADIKNSLTELAQ